VGITANVICPDLVITDVVKAQVARRRGRERHHR
jgi:hypothetical protein